MLETNQNNSYETQRNYSIGSEIMSPAITVGQWLIMFILMAIPIVNVVVIIIWAMDSQGNPNRSNFARAVIVVFALSILLSAMFFGAIMGMLQSFAYMF